MNTQIKKITLILIALILMNLLTACDTLMQAASDAIAPLSQLEKVCHQQAVDKASAYDASAGKIHPIAVFQRSGASEESYDLVTSTLLPTGWAVESEEADPATVELVACITRASEEIVETCEYEDEEDASKTYMLDVYDASYEVKVFAATSGKELGNTTIKTSLGDMGDPCPSYYVFTEGAGKENFYASVSGDGLDEFLGQYIQP